ncbi:MAG: N-acetyltransferase [Candidatus Bathyarchaeota archaeon]|nr:N-acetyltransferase [Candidatus Bathyarchaeota archaeon]
MGNGLEIVGLTPENYVALGCPCFLNPKHPAHLRKLEWLKDRFSEGFTIKSLFAENEKRPIGFIEYTQGENAWRAVDAPDYLFIHCIWISPNKYKQQGNGSLLVNDCIQDAEAQGKTGVAVVTSSGPFMASKDLFLKNGFEQAAQDDHFELLVKQLKNGVLPKFNDWRKQLSQYKGLNIVYSNQCPWVIRSISELKETAEENKVPLKIVELKTPQDAQNSPSIYATFNLIYDGKIFADHYLSKTRFFNILKKELNLM